MENNGRNYNLSDIWGGGLDSKFDRLDQLQSDAGRRAEIPHYA